MLASSKFCLLGIFLFFAGCAHLDRRIASQAPSQSCPDSLLKIAEEKVWTRETLVKAADDPELRKKFIEYIHFNYDESFRKRIGDLAIKINGFGKDEIYFRFFQELEKAKRQYAKFLSLLKRAPSTKRAPQRNWIYFYADKFAVDESGEPLHFKKMIKYLDYWKNELNADVLYFLPITKSPKKDGGYDVADYREIIEAMGGNKAFFEFVKAAREKGLNIVMDFVPGHVSDEQVWFQKALAGDQKYIDYFLHRDELPPIKVNRRDGNAYAEYEGPDGPYERLLLFPDLSESQWNPSKLATGEEKSFYSSFFSFQKDLNLQNPNVLGEHFATIGHWISNGVGGIRADAIPWWVKLEGHEGEHADETFAISELFYLFITTLKKDDPIYLPELVDAIETGARYVGPEVVRDGKKMPQLANSLFNFEKVVHALYAGIEGDFSAHFQYLNRYRQIQFPEGYEEVLYTGNHHDEIYLGFLPEKAKQRMQKRIKKANGVVYKGGNSGGAMVSDLLDQDVSKQQAFFKWIYGHFGSKAIYQGMELGSQNSWRVAYEQTQVIIDELIQKGELSHQDEAVVELKNILASPHLSQEPLDESSPLFKYIDGRLLHRNPIIRERIEEAREGKNPMFNFFQFLTRSQLELPAFGRGGVEEALNTWDNNVGSFMRRARDSEGKVEQEIAVLKNGTDAVKTLRMSLQDLTQKTDFKLSSIDPNGSSDFSFKLDSSEGFVEIVMQAQETLWLEVK